MAQEILRNFFILHHSFEYTIQGIQRTVTINRLIDVDVLSGLLGNRNFLIHLITIGRLMLCIQGNHELRPHHIDTYKEVEWNGGIVYREDKYPNLLFAKDGEIYHIQGTDFLVCGGAYSVFKDYRIAHGLSWYYDEQPSAMGC